MINVIESCEYPTIEKIMSFDPPDNDTNFGQTQSVDRNEAYLTTVSDEVNGQTITIHDDLCTKDSSLNESYSEYDHLQFEDTDEARPTIENWRSDLGLVHFYYIFNCIDSKLATHTMKSPVYDDNDIDENWFKYSKPELELLEPEMDPEHDRNYQSQDFRMRLSKIKEEVTKYLERKLSSKSNHAL